MTTPLTVPGHRRRAARRSTSWSSCSARTRGSRRSRAATPPTEALRVLQESEVDAVFLDVQMPGLTGLDLAQVLRGSRSRRRWCS